jgi:carboxymethylenebutenolidase
MSQSQTIEYLPGKKPASGLLALPNGKGGPGIVFVHAWWGLNDFAAQTAKNLAKEGFVVLAPDLYNGAVAKTAANAKKLRSKVDSKWARLALEGAVEYLRRDERSHGHGVGLVGFSYGAWWGLWLAGDHPAVKAVVTFYGTRVIEYEKSQAAYQAHFAESDEFESDKSRKAMEDAITKAGREAEFHVYPDTGHWFFEKDVKSAYDPKAAKVAWERTVKFLKTHLA